MILLRYMLLLLYLLIAVKSACAGGMSEFEGSVTTFDNVTSSGMLYAYANVGSESPTPLPDKINITIKNSAGSPQRYAVETEAVEKIIYSGKVVGSSCREGSRTTQIVVMKNGKRFEQTTCPALLMPEGGVYVDSRNPLTGEPSYDEIPWERVKEIHLGNGSGQVRQDEQGHTFPSDYLYSPYTGEKMNLVDIK
ncbi:hypothetical protein [Mariprofundus ferrooxydans]|uniref:hypothetical protein n=1 Tax=Mariprofundus ferrooxydans TaxID=314344 RepID=UPI00143167E7|nr:hypothetical protein [Mariprofundus ferrooxydans]